MAKTKSKRQNLPDDKKINKLYSNDSRFSPVSTLKDISYRNIQ